MDKEEKRVFWKDKEQAQRQKGGGYGVVGKQGVNDAWL